MSEILHFRVHSLNWVKSKHYEIITTEKQEKQRQRLMIKEKQIPVSFFHTFEWTSWCFFVWILYTFVLKTTLKWMFTTDWNESTGVPLLCDFKMGIQRGVNINNNRMKKFWWFSYFLWSFTEILYLFCV